VHYDELPARQFGHAMKILNNALYHHSFISFEIDCFHDLWTEKYFHSMTKLAGLATGECMKSDAWKLVALRVGTFVVFLVIFIL
jgi:hypothetical protein